MDSTLDKPTLVEIVRNRLNLPPNEAPRIGTLVSAGMERLARAVKDSEDRNKLLALIANKNPTAGVLDLSTSDFENILTDTLRRPGAIRTHTDSRKIFRCAPSYDALRATMPDDADMVWFFLQDDNLIFRNPADAALNTYATPLDLVASYIPEPDSVDRPLPLELEERAIDYVAEVVRGAPGEQFVQLDRDSAAQQR